MKIVKDFVLRTIAGESILIPTGATSQEFNGMINLSATAAFIWENIEKAESLDDMVSLITGEFEIDDDTARFDAVGFINELLAHGMVQLSDVEKNW